MSVNFYNDSGFMVTVDAHDYKPAPPLSPHVTCAPLSWSAVDSSLRTASISSNGHPMIQIGLDLSFVPHVPMPSPPPGAVAFPVQWAKIMVISGSVAYMSVHKVTGEGQKLACCVAGRLGMNVNCNEPCDFPNGLVFQSNTVETQPTLGDYLGAVVAYAMDALLAFVVGVFGDGLSGGLDLGVIGQAIVEAILQTIFRILPNVPIIGKYFDPGGLGGPVIQKLIDGD